MSLTKQRFLWTKFYGAVADKLLDYRDDRRPLIKGIHKIASRLSGLSYLQDRFTDGSTEPLEDICPFTALGTFNRGMTDENRKAIAAEIANMLGVDVPVPESFEGLPVLNNQNSWFFAPAEKRGNGDIDALWKVFAAAGRFVKSDQVEHRAEFAEAYDAATKVRGVAWNLSAGLYWTHPWDFLPLDSLSRQYMTEHLDLRIPTSGGKGPCDAKSYLKLLDDLKARFDEESYPVHSFPELSLEAWYQKHPERPPTPKGDAEPGARAPEPSGVAPDPATLRLYTIDHALADLFLRREENRAPDGAAEAQEKPHPPGAAGDREDLPRSTPRVAAGRRAIRGSYRGRAVSPVLRV